MERPELTGLEKPVIDYIEYLEGCLNGSSELILALNRASKVFALDLDKICDGDDYEIKKTKSSEGEDIETEICTLVFLSPDSKDKTFDKVMKLFEKFDSIKTLSQYFKSTEKEKSTGNTFEDTSRKIQAKLNGVGK